MLDDVEAGAVYLVTRHGRDVAQVVPLTSSTIVTPARRPGPSRTVELPRLVLPGGSTFDDFMAGN